MKIVDLHGKELMVNKLSMGENNINMSELKRGVYMLILQNKDSCG